MLQPQTLSDFNDDNLQLSQQGTQQRFKLPKIDRPFSRQNQSHKNQKVISPLLPNINLNFAAIQKQTSQKLEQSPIKIVDENQKEGFAYQIQQKLKKVMGNMGAEQEIQEQQQNEDFDFEALVDQNREILKQQKIQNDKVPRQVHSNNLIEIREEKRNTKSKSKTTKISQIQSMKQKKMKEYRNMSNENKYIQKKKEIISQKNQAIDKIKSLANKNKQSSSRPLPPKPKHKQSSANLKDNISVKDNLSLSNSDEGKNVNLYDNIHNFLQNPKKTILNRSQSLLKKLGKANLRQLEQKLKVMNDKLGHNENLETKSTQENFCIDRTVRDWKRMEINSGKKLSYQSSNFQKQVDRLGCLQDKNSDCLQKYLDQQKILVELGYSKKIVSLTKIEDKL